MANLKIPSPWSSGYAIPNYVRAEGLQSRAFVTKWAPRGTYDDPDAYDPSLDHAYAIPQYIKDEGYGQGAMVSEMAPRGFYVGQVKKQIEKAQKFLGEYERTMPAEYGRQTAAQIMSVIGSLPPAQQKDQLRAMLGVIDPTLWARVGSLLQHYIDRGVRGRAALELALARALSTPAEYAPALGDAVPPKAAPPARTAPRTTTVTRNDGYLAKVSTDPIRDYGEDTARAIIARIRDLPAEYRKLTLRNILSAIDGSLYERTERFARQYQAAGAQPLAALEQGLARAMSEGIADEIIETGQRRRPPRPKGQLGLGCYGVVTMRGFLGLGQYSTKVSPTTYDTSRGTTSEPTKAPAPEPPPQKGQCSADGQYVWDITSDGSGFWRRRTATETCTTYAGTGPTVREGGGGGITGEGASSAGAAPEVSVTFAKVGPFSFPVDQAFARIAWRSKLPADWQAEIKRLLATASGAGSTVSSTGYQLDKFIDAPPASFPTRFISVSVTPATTGPMAWAPVAKAKHPKTGEDYGVFIGLGSTYPDKPRSSPDNPPILYVYWAKVRKDEPWYLDVWNLIKEVVVAVTDVAAEVLNTVGGIACNFLTGEGAAAAGAVAAASQGVPPQTGAQGVQIAAASCGVPPPPAAAADDDWLLPVAIGGGVVVAAMLLLPKKKKA